jgi:hypothetical protein
VGFAFLPPLAVADQYRVLLAIMKLLAILSLAFALSTNLASAATCTGYRTCAKGGSVMTQSAVDELINCLCGSFTAGGGEYTFTCTAFDACDNCQAQMQLQPYTTNSNCANALQDIYTQCQKYDGSGCSYASGTWQLGGEWYWMYATVEN